MVGRKQWKANHLLIAGSTIRLQLSVLFEQSRDIILVMTPDGRLVDVNQAAVDVYGYDRDALVGLTVVDLRDPTTIPDLTGELRRANDEGMLFETRHRRRDGSIFPVEVSTHGVGLDGDRFLFSIVRDISKRRRSDENQAWLSAIVESSSDAIISFDLEGRVTSWNPAATRMFGYTADDVMGLPLSRGGARVRAG